MRVLALDIATASGWATDGCAVCPPRFGTWRVPGGTANLGHAIFRFNQWLYEIAATYQPDIIAYEAPFMSSGGGKTNPQTMFLLIGLCAVAESVAYAHKVRAIQAHVQTVRKHFVGHGRPDNPKKVVAARCRQLGWDVRDDNAADACAIWTWAKATHDRTFRLETGALFAGAAP